jgi:hypothetical protein
MTPDEILYELRIVAEPSRKRGAAMTKPMQTSAVGVRQIGLCSGQVAWFGHAAP